MASKKSAVQRIWDEFFALPQRERLLALVAIVGFLFLLVDFTWVRPRMAQTKDVQTQLDQARTEANNLTRAAAEVSRPPPAEATAAKRAERDRLRAVSERADSMIHQATGDARMGEMIRTLVSNTPGVTLLSLKTLGAQSFYTPGAPAPVAASRAASGAKAPAAPLASFPPVYKHGLEVTLKGNYLALSSYLSSLESGIPGVYWGGAVASVAYPDTTVKVTLFTLSTQPELSFE